jgi:hypothetical protein
MLLDHLLKTSDQGCVFVFPGRHTFGGASISIKDLRCGEQVTNSVSLTLYLLPVLLRKCSHRSTLILVPFLERSSYFVVAHGCVLAMQFSYALLCCS